MMDEEVKEKIWAMSEDEYKEFMKEIHLNYPLRTRELTNTICNFWKKDDKKTELRPQQPTVSSSQPKTGEGVGSCSGQQSKAVPSQLKASLSWQLSAWQSGFIFRGDKIPDNGRLFLDVEKVTMRKQPGAKKHEQKAATVAIVNQDGKLILWAFIRRPHKDVCQYAPKITNLSEGKLDIGIDIETLHGCLQLCLKGNNTLVGQHINGDLNSMEYNYDNILDLETVYKDSKGQRFSLGLIATQVLNNRSGFQKDFHSAIDDAKMTLAAYKKYMEINRIPGELSKLNSKMERARSEYNQNKARVWAEKCSCPK